MIVSGVISSDPIKKVFQNQQQDVEACESVRTLGNAIQTHRLQGLLMLIWYSRVSWVLAPRL